MTSPELAPIQPGEAVSTPGSTNNSHSPNNTAQSVDASAPSPTPSNMPTPNIHNFAGTTVKLQVNDAVFLIHEPRITKFASLNQLVGDARRVDPQSDTLTITVQGGDELPSDFLRTFKLLSSSSIEEPVDPNTEMLVSAARISSVYHHPTLLAFCIKKLEEQPLGLIERFRIGRTLELKSWQDLACKELSEREEVLTKEEALSLGFDAYFQVASMREKRQKVELDGFRSEVRAPTQSQARIQASRSPTFSLVNMDMNLNQID